MRQYKLSDLSFALSLHLLSPLNSIRNGKNVHMCFEFQALITFDSTFSNLEKKIPNRNYSVEDHLTAHIILQYNCIILIVCNSITMTTEDKKYILCVGLCVLDVIHICKDFPEEDSDRR